MVIRRKYLKKFHKVGVMVYLTQANDPMTAVTSGQGTGHCKLKHLCHSSSVKQGFVQSKTNLLQSQKLMMKSSALQHTFLKQVVLFNFINDF